MDFVVSNIQHFSLHDGPGIRTTVFLSGCPLKCKWCQNPETQKTTRSILFKANKCISCGRCTECKKQAHIIKDGRHIFERSKCNSCGECIDLCPCNTLEFSNRVISQTELADETGRQKSFYGSRGGVTFSGGEPLLQWEAISEFCDSTDVSVAVETCGYIESGIFSKVLEKADYIMYDLKLANEEQHIEYTGMSNKLILKNYELLKQSKVDFCVRTPLIPGITDTEENLAALKVIIGDKKWEKLEYNTMAPQKYEWLGMKYDL